jgi:ParB family chromosome partitioning protein
MTTTQAAATASRPTLPLSSLFLSPSNVRKSFGKSAAKSIESMAASILSCGVIQNLVVTADPANPNRFGVIVGGRRYRSLSLLLERGDITGDYPVPYDLRSEAEATEVSAQENMQRENMHAADEFDAFVKLTSEGKTIDQIADAFGVTPLVVERRLLLAKAAPALLALFRDDVLTTEQLIGLCSTDDHALQVSTWNNAPSYNRSPDALRRAVTSKEVDASKDLRVSFIGGVAAFEAAGGKVRRDLFSTNGSGGFIRDGALLDKLVANKLEAVAKLVAAEGWGWVETHGSFDYQVFHRFGQIEPEQNELPAEARATVDALKAEAKALQTEQREMEDREDGDYTDEESDRMEAIEVRSDAISSELDFIHSANASFNAESKKHAGAWVAFCDGNIRIERGLVKTEDRKAVQQAAPIQGGRESKPAGRKDNALSDALRRELLGHRILAVQSETSKNVRVAKVLLACNIIANEKDLRHTVPCDMTISGQYSVRATNKGEGADFTAKAKAFEAAGIKLFGKIPSKADAMWDAVFALTDAELDQIIAYGVAQSVAPDDKHTGMTAKLLGALNFKMADHFQVNAENYLARVPKPLIVEALRESGKAKDEKALLGKKRGELASEAAAQLVGTGWTPAIIRTPAPKVEKETKPTLAKVAKTGGKKAPANPAVKKTAKHAKPIGKRKA